MPTCYRHPGRESYIRCQRCERTICPDCMNEAAVGYQCPTCVAEGKRQTRQGRATYGGQRSGNPALTSMVLIAANAAVFLAITLTGGAGSRLVDLLGLRSSGLCALGRGNFLIGEPVCVSQNGAWLPGFLDGAWWQVATSGFTHVAIWHIGFNMLALWFLGPTLEHVLGRARFLALYLLSLATASVVVLWGAPEYQLTIGASGAIYGLFAALLLVARKVGGDIRSLSAIVLVNVVITFTVPNISWQGHLGGFLGGALVAAIVVYAPRQRRGLWQLVGLCSLAVLLLAAVATRVATG